MDSRDGTGGISGKFVNGTPRNFDVAETGATVPGTAVAITGNLTVTTQSKSGFVFLGPTAAPNPSSSTLNFPVGDTRANAVTVGLNGTGGARSRLQELDVGRDHEPVPRRHRLLRARNRHHLERHGTARSTPRGTDRAVRFARPIREPRRPTPSHTIRRT